MGLGGGAGILPLLDLPPLESRFYSVTSGDSMSCFGDRKKSLVTVHEILQKEQMVFTFALQPP